MFSKDIYKKQNGSLYIVLSWLMFVLFLLLIVIIFLPGQITFPNFLKDYAEFLSILLGLLCIIGFVGFPLSLCLYKGMKNLYVNGRLNLNDDKIYYIKQTEALWTIFGRSTEYATYNIEKIDKFDISKRWIKIYGRIEKEVIYRKSSTNKTTTTYVKIARAFDTDQKIIEFLKKKGGVV